MFGVERERRFKMKKWEYVFTELVAEPGLDGPQARLKAKDKANELGERGWELVTIFENGVAVFKKEKEE